MVSFDDAESARNQFQASGLGLKITKFEEAILNKIGSRIDTEEIEQAVYEAKN